MEAAELLLLFLLVVQGCVVIWKLWQPRELRVQNEWVPYHALPPVQEEPFLPPVLPSADVPFALPADDDSWWQRGECPPWERED